MADWKNADHYAFADAKQNPTRWVWEFLRRNQKYRSDFGVVGKKEQKELRLHRKAAGSNHVQLVFPVRKMFGRKWHLAGAIQDPADDTIPKFALRPPEVPSLREVALYYEESASDGDAYQNKRYAVVVYRLSEDLVEQLAASKAILEKLRSSRGVQPASKSILNKVFGRYLRVFDARSAGATTKQITEHIKFYSDIAEKSVDPQAVHKRINKDRKLALERIADPLSILRR